MKYGYATYSVHCDTFNQLCKCDDSLDYVGRPPVLASVCKDLLLASLEFISTTIYLILSAVQLNSPIYNFKVSKIKNCLGAWPLDHAITCRAN